MPCLTSCKFFFFFLTTRFPPDHYTKVRTKLTDMFEGLTAYSRAPAEGLWGSSRNVEQNDIFVAEVMVDDLDRSWWNDYRRKLEQLFRQERSSSEDNHMSVSSSSNKRFR